MKKYVLLVIVIILISSLFIIIKLSQGPVKKMLQENENRIHQVFVLCENDDSADIFAAKAWLMMEDHIKWANRYSDILKQKLELANEIDKQWIEVIYTLGASLENDTNELRKEKKLAAMSIIGKNIKKEDVINFFKNKPGINQEALSNYARQ